MKTKTQSVRMTNDQTWTSFEMLQKILLANLVRPYVPLVTKKLGENWVRVYRLQINCKNSCISVSIAGTWTFSWENTEKLQKTLESFYNFLPSGQRHRSSTPETCSCFCSPFWWSWRSFTPFVKHLRNSWTEIRLKSGKAGCRSVKFPAKVAIKLNGP